MALTDFWSAARYFSVAGTLVRMGCDRGPGGKGFGNSRPLGKFGACLTGYTLDPFHISRYLDHSVTDSLSNDACSIPSLHHNQVHHESIILNCTMSTAQAPQSVFPRSHVGFDSITSQIERKLLKRGFQFNVICVGTSELPQASHALLSAIA